MVHNDLLVDLPKPVFCVVDNYDWLVNGSAQNLVEKFMKEEHCFDQYTEVNLTIYHSYNYNMLMCNALWIWLCCFISASGGVPYSVQRDLQPSRSGLFWHDLLGLWGTQTRAGKESTDFCSNPCGTTDQHTSWTMPSVRLPRLNFFVFPPQFNWSIFIFSLLEGPQYGLFFGIEFFIFFKGSVKSLRPFGTRL